jgi:hypothetical protein
MNKQYIILLSSLIACTSKGMNREEYPTRMDQKEFMAQKENICAIDEEINKSVNALKDTLNEDALIAKIEEALQPYESNPQVRRAFIQSYACRPATPSVTIQVGEDTEDWQGRVWQYAVNNTGSRIAVLTDMQYCRPESFFQKLTIWGEEARGQWTQLAKYEVIRRMYDSHRIYLLLNGDAFVWRYPSEDNTRMINLRDYFATGLSLEQVDIALQQELAQPFVLENVRGWLDGRKVVYRKDRRIDITETELMVQYRTTLADIAKYLVKKAQHVEQTENPQVQHVEQTENLQSDTKTE